MMLTCTIWLEQRRECQHTAAKMCTRNLYCCFKSRIWRRCIIQTWLPVHLLRSWHHLVLQCAVLSRKVHLLFVAQMHCNRDRRAHVRADTIDADSLRSYSIRCKQWMCISVAALHPLSSSTAFVLRDPQIQCVWFVRAGCWMLYVLWTARAAVAVRYAHEELSPADFDAKWVKYFEDDTLDSREIRRGLNDVFAHDLIPDPTILTAALRATRRVNDFPTWVSTGSGVSFA